jgi:hypothetical protein
LHNCPGRSTIHAPDYLIEPAMGNVFLPQGSGIAMLFESGRVDDETLRKGSLKSVYLVFDLYTHS